MYEDAFAAKIIEHNIAHDALWLTQASARINSGWIMLSDDKRSPSLHDRWIYAASS